MERVKTCGDLHSLCLIDSISVSQDDSAFLKRRSAVGEEVFDDEIFRNFGVDERSGKDAGRCFHALKIIDAQVRELVQNYFGRSGSNLIDHAPGACYSGWIVNVRSKRITNVAQFHPGIDYLHQ